MPVDAHSIHTVLRPLTTVTTPETTGKWPRRNGAFQSDNMRTASWYALVLRAFMAAVLCCAMVGGASAQGEEQAGDLVYRFKLEGVNDPVAAKPVQYTILETSGVHMCTFNEEDAYLKVACVRTPGHSFFRSLLDLTGHALAGPVMVSDGSMIMQGPTATPDK